MTPEQSIQLFSTGLYIFLGIMIVGFGLAVLFFFLYKIPTVYALMTGRTQKKTIEKMQKSGQLRSEEELEAEREAYRKSSDLSLGMTGEYMTEAIAKARPTLDNTEAFSYGANAESMETTVLEAATETTVLAPETETTVLSPEAETTVLNQGGYLTPGATIESPGPGKYERMQTNMNDRLENYKEPASYEDVTTPLAGGGPQYYFESTEHTIVIHTDEDI